MTKKQHYMTWEERQKLEVLYNNLRLPVAVIAKTLGFCTQTIYNELKVGMYWHTFDYRDVKRYSAEKAQDIHRWNQTAKGRPLKIGNDHAFADFIERKIHHDCFSPAAALVEAKKAGYRTNICRATLYSYIYKGVFREVTSADLWQHRSKRVQSSSGSFAGCKERLTKENTNLARNRKERKRAEGCQEIGNITVLPIT